MKTAGVILEDWKLPVFKKILDEQDFEYEQHVGPTKGLITLTVKFEIKNMNKLNAAITQAKNESRKKKLH